MQSLLRQSLRQQALGARVGGLRLAAVPVTVRAGVPRRPLAVRASPALRSAPEKAPGAAAEGAAPAGGAGAAKPRAAGAVTKGRRKPWHFWASMALVSGGGALAWYVYDNYGSPAKAWAAAKAWFGAMVETPMADPTIDELKRAMGPPAPEGYINVILALEHVLIRRDWDARHGWKVEIRPGVKALLQELTQAGCLITFWGEGASSTVLEVYSKMSLELGLQAVAVTQLHLGNEHTFGRPGGDKARERHIEFFNRDPRTILVIDADPITQAVNPLNTVLVQPIPGSKRPDGTPLVPPSASSASTEDGIDNTCATIAAVAARIREAASANGRVDVPAALRSLKAEAASEGFGSDSAGLYAYLRHRAAAEAEAARVRREQGLGGLVRRANAASPLLRNKATVLEAAEYKGYVEPGRDVGEESMVTKKVRAAVAKMEASMRGGAA